MIHETPLITTIVAGLVLAFIFGTIANRLRLPPLVGYLIAGIVVGPYSPGFVADQALALELSEIGVILLMFGVGLNFSLKDLLSVQALAIPGALARMAAGTLMGLGLALLMGWSVFAGLIFGLALSVASTVVLLKALHDRHLVESERGRIAVGWVIVEDIAMILALVLIPAFAGLASGTATAPVDPFVSFIERIFRTDIGLAGIVAVSLVKLAAFVGFMLIVGRRLIPMLLHFIAHSGSRELFRLAVLAIALGVAAGSAYLFGVSLALGAFFAGMILSESELSHRAAQETLPLRDAFAVLFFVAVGMLFDPMIIVRSPLPVLGVLFVILIGKSAVAFFTVIAFGRSVQTALTISASLAQVGEFSFILASLGIGLGILPPEGRDLIVAGAIVSIILNPLAFWGAERLRPWIEARLHRGGIPRDGAEPAPGAGGAVSSAEPAASSEEVAAAEAVHQTALAGHAVLIGYGRVGRVIAEGLLRAKAPFLVIEDADSRVAAARAAGIEVVAGNAASAGTLRLANVAGASSLLVAIPNAFEAGQAAEQGRKLNPNLRIVARAHSDEEELHLAHLGADSVVLGEREIGLGMLAWLNGGAPPPEMEFQHSGPAAARAQHATEAVASLAPAENLLVQSLQPSGIVPPTPGIDVGRGDDAYPKSPVADPVEADAPIPPALVPEALYPAPVLPELAGESPSASGDPIETDFADTDAPPSDLPPALGQAGSAHEDPDDILFPVADGESGHAAPASDASREATTFVALEPGAVLQVADEPSDELAPIAAAPAIVVPDEPDPHPQPEWASAGGRIEESPPGEISVPEIAREQEPTDSPEGARPDSPGDELPGPRPHVEAEHVDPEPAVAPPEVPAELPPELPSALPEEMPAPPLIPEEPGPRPQPFNPEVSPSVEPEMTVPAADSAHSGAARELDLDEDEPGRAEAPPVIPERRS